MSFPARISTCPTVPEMLRAEADRRAARAMRSLPAAVWSRPAVVSVAGYAPLVASLPKGPRDAEFRSSRSAAAARARALARSRRACSARLGEIAPIRHGGWDRARIALCFAGAGTTLAGTRLLLQAGLLTPDAACVAMRWSDRMTGTAMRLWRRRRRKLDGREPFGQPP